MGETELWAAIHECRANITDVATRLARVTDRVDDHDDALVEESIDKANRANVLHGIYETVQKIKAKLDAVEKSRP